MAKRTTKQNPKGDQGASFQIPEVAPTAPSTDGSVPHFSASALIAAGSVPVPKERPTFPTPAGDYDPESMHRARANQSDAIITLRRPAHSRTTTLGTELIGDCAVLNQLGTRQPQKVLISKSDDKKWFFIMPTHHKSNKAVKIRYSKGLANINLFGPFDEMGRLVEKGFRESFALAITSEPVTIHGVKGFALYFSLTQFLKESIKERDEETAEGSVKTTKKRAATAQTQSPTPEITAETASAQPATAPEATEPAAEDEEYSALERINEQMLADSDEKIRELERKLKAYEKKLGKL
ncbi:MAG TPA: hypothetical protein VK191_06160 [Symbiobacteriaceae bacterium]|nr:hypothetical protein [Symbiobacteriaceae bacterium]